jgi:hypothetical protein
MDEDEVSTSPRAPPLIPLKLERQSHAGRGGDWLHFRLAS